MPTPSWNLIYPAKLFQRLIATLKKSGHKQSPWKLIKMALSCLFIELLWWELSFVVVGHSSVEAAKTSKLDYKISCYFHFYSEDVKLN